MRGNFNELKTYPQWIATLLNNCETAGAWTTGIASDKKLRGSSVNIDVYSFDEIRGLAICQVRQCIFRPNRFNKIRKDYYLIGRNEIGTAFAHPVDVRAAGRVVGDDVTAGVTLALCRIWACREQDLDDIVRNGDVAFVPIPELPTGAELVESNNITIRDSHHVRGLRDGKIYQANGKYYIVGSAKIEHAKRQHKTVKTKEGVWRIQAGLRSRTWGFTAPTAD